MTLFRSFRRDDARPRRRRVAALLMLAALAAPCLWAADEDFALAFRIDAPADESLFAVELTPAVYAALTTDDLSDLAVIDADGRLLATSLQRPPAPTPQAPDVLALPPPLALPAEASETPGELHLHVRRGPDGRLSTVGLRAVDGDVGATSPREWLLDLGALAKDGVDGLRLAAEASGDFRLKLDVRASDDLVQWETVQAALPLLRVTDGGRAIERLDLRFPRTHKRYLALRAVGEAAAPADWRFAALRLRAPAPPALATVTLDARTVSADDLVIDYGPLGPLPLREVDVRLRGDNEVQPFTVEQAEGERWRTVAAGTAWRLTSGSESLASGPVEAWSNGSGALRLRLSQPTEAPALVVGYRPDRLLVLGSGPGPLRLVAGSLRARGSRASMDEPLAAIRARRGEDWQPPLAALGPPTPLAGARAVTPRIEPGRIGLWLVLGSGALAVGGMAWRLLRRPAAPVDDAGV